MRLYWEYVDANLLQYFESGLHLVVSQTNSAVVGTSLSLSGVIQNTILASVLEWGIRQPGFTPTCLRQSPQSVSSVCYVGDINTSKKDQMVVTWQTENFDSYFVRKILYLDANSAEICFQGTVNNKLPLVQRTAWRWRHGKPLSELIIVF